MNKKGSSKNIVNYITIRAGCLMLGRGYISHYSEYALSSSLSIYITFIAIVLREFNAVFLCHCWFLLYYGAADMQIWALLTRSQCRVSDTQVTVKALGPLVHCGKCTISWRKIKHPECISS